MTLGTILLIVLILLLIGAIPAWPYSRGWGYGPSGVVGLIVIVLSATAVVAQEKPQAEVNASTIAASIRRGVDYLIADQNPNGSWGGATRTKGLNIYAPLPGAHHAFRAGASGLALAGLIDSGDQRPAMARTWSA